MIWINCLSAVLFLSNCMCGLSSIAERKVLMLLQKGGGTDVRDVWIDNANITQIHRHHLNLDLREIILEGNYRTDLPVDSMPYNEVHLIFLNAVADPLWRMVFNRTAVTSGKWFEEVKRSSSNISGYNTTITVSRQSRYPLCIGTGGCTDPAWAGIWSSEFTDSPLFLFNADPHVPQILPQPTWETVYIACESKETFTMEFQYEDQNRMRVQDCLKKCTDFPYMLMQMGYKCLCGKRKPGFTFSTNSFPDSNCDKNCPNSKDRCGAQDSMFIAVYEIHEKEPQNLGDIPCSLIFTTHTVTNGEILVSKENLDMGSAVPYFYLHGHKLVTREVVGSYVMYYNSKDCDNATRKPYTDLRTETKMKYEFRKQWNTTLIPVVCVWFIPDQLIMATLAIEVNIEVCRPTSGRYFFPADYLAVIGVYQTEPVNNIEMSTAKQDLTFTIESSGNSVTELSESGYTELSSVGASFDSSFTKDRTSSAYDEMDGSTGGTAVTVADGITDETDSSGSDPAQVFVTESSDNQWIQRTISEHLTDDVTSATSNSVNSITDITTHVIRSNTKGNVSPSDSLCTCVCEGHGVNLTKEELQEKIERIESILKVNKKELSSSYRKLISAPDPRPSSKGIGASGIVVIFFCVGVIILMDLSNLKGMVEFWSSLTIH